MKLNFESTYPLNTQYNNPKHFIVIGAGGTGGYFIPNLARQISIQNKLRTVEGMPLHMLTIVDGDEVSASNLTRQNFLPSDLNENKAEVMSQRYGPAFELNISYVDEYIVDTKMLKNLASTDFHPHTRRDRFDPIPVFVDCVDNNKTRKIIHDAVNELNTHRQVFYISSGNEAYNGQVVCGYKHVESTTERNRNIFNLPMVGDMFPEILEGADKLPTELSCDEAAVSHPQNIMTNITAANLLFNFSNVILTSNIYDQDNPGLKYFAQTFNTQTGKINTFMNKESILSQFIVTNTPDPDGTAFENRMPF